MTQVYEEATDAGFDAGLDAGFDAGFWQRRLSGAAEPTVLGVERAVAGSEVRTTAELALSEEETVRILGAARRFGVSPDAFAVAVFGLLLAEYSGGHDVLWGVAVDGAVLPARVDADPDRPLGTYLTAVHRDQPGAERRSWPRLPGGLPEGTAVLDRVLRVGPNGPAPELDGRLLVVAAELGLRQVALTIRHDPARLDEDAALRLLGHFRRLLTATAGAAPGAPLGSLTALDAHDLRLQLHTWNDTDRPTADPACIHELFERQAARTPDATAVLQGPERLSYAELDARADRVAARLAAAGVGPGDFVSVHLNRTVHAVVALLGVLKSGAAYAPMEPSLPAERVRLLLADLGVTVAIAAADRVDKLCAAATGLPELREILWLGAEDDSPAAVQVTACADAGLRLSPAEARTEDPAPRRTAEPGDLAYVIFTSGSTGTPKGVLLQHAPVVNLIRWVNRTHRVGPQDRVLFITSFGFDLSVYDVFGVLAAGGSVRVASEEEIRDPERLLSVLDTEPITFWDSAPAALQQLEPLLPLRPAPVDSALRLVFLSGDWVPLTLPGAVRAAFPKARVVALGGATEAAIWSNHFPVGDIDPSWTSVPYGRPLDNARYYVLDDRLRPLPVGVPGDLYIGGGCLASGYHGAPKTTARKFVPDPFGAEPGGVLYQTGDRARFGPDGLIEFLGRLDNQVKVRGYRIELGEIETALAALPGVGSAVATVHPSAGSQLLVAYVVPAPGAAVDPEACRAALAGRLPGYMVPSAVLLLRSLPATANGKLDRRALPLPDRAGGQPPTTGEGRSATATEKAVAEVWEQVLGVRPSSGSDFFTDLGGESLTAVRVVAKLRTVLGTDVPIRALLENSRLCDFAAAVDAAADALVPPDPEGG